MGLLCRAAFWQSGIIFAHRADFCKKPVPVFRQLA
jgi:hypothetical protein